MVPPTSTAITHNQMRLSPIRWLRGGNGSPTGRGPLVPPSTGLGSAADVVGVTGWPSAGGALTTPPAPTSSTTVTSSNTATRAVVRTNSDTTRHDMPQSRATHHPPDTSHRCADLGPHSDQRAPVQGTVEPARRSRPPQRSARAVSAHGRTGARISAPTAIGARRFGDGDGGIRAQKLKVVHTLKMVQKLSRAH